MTKGACQSFLDESWARVHIRQGRATAARTCSHPGQGVPMRALHALLATVSPLVILSACGGPRNDSPPPNTDSAPSQAQSTPPLPGDSGSFIVSVRLLMPDGRVVDVPTLKDSTDAIFTTVSVLDSILIPYYDKKDKAMADSLRRSRTLIGNPHAYARHRLTSRSSVEAIE